MSKANDLTIPAYQVMINVQKETENTSQDSLVG